MAEPWFYFPQLDAGLAEVMLSADEAQHAAGARRLHEGDRVTLFDGKGLRATGEISALTSRPRSVSIRVINCETTAPPRDLHLASALPKGDRQRVLIDMVTQLGIHRFTPLVCEHSVVKAGENSIGRWQRIMIEACKQSRQAWLPQIGDAATVEGLVHSIAGSCTIVISHPDGRPLADILPGADQPIVILIGPEAGFTTDEVETVTGAGGVAVSLGRSILRTETAAVAAVTLANQVKK